MTHCRLLARIDARLLDEVLAAFFIRWEASQRCASDPSRLQTSQSHRDHAQLAIDGKTFRATSTQAHPVHQLSCSDVTRGEAACQTRTGAVPGLLARLNSTVLSLMDRLGVRNVARQARYFDAELEQAIQLILTGQCSVF